MSDIEKIKNNGLISLLHNSGNIENLKPYKKEIFLFDTYIAGTSHVENIDKIEPSIKVGDRLSFFREPDNEYDEMAIVIKTEDDFKVGYIPQKDNIVFSRLMDAGKLLFGKIKSKELKNKWIKIDIDIYLSE